MRISRLSLFASLVAVSSSIMALVGACANESPPPATAAGGAASVKGGAPATSHKKREAKEFKKTADGQYSYVLGNQAQLQSVFPVAGQPLLPPIYTADAASPAGANFQTLQSSITWFTGQSMTRDGIQIANLSVNIDGSGNVVVVIWSSSSQSTLEAFAAAQQVFVSQLFAYQGFQGAWDCHQKPGCWDPSPNPNQPWASYLPLGLQIINNRAVLLLDYPPAVSLIAADYLNNATLNRWSQLLVTAGSKHTGDYMTIVDARPIAAPGGKAPNDASAGSLLPPPVWFNGQDVTYITPMLNLLDFVMPPTVNPWPIHWGTKPIAVLGYPAAQAWVTVVGGNAPKPRESGQVSIAGAGGDTTNWIASNHPIATAYDRCDNESKLEYDELTDIYGACMIATFGGETTLGNCADWSAPEPSWPPPNLSPDRLYYWCAQTRWDVCNQYGMPPYSYDKALGFCRYYHDPCTHTDCGDGAQTGAPPQKK